MSEECHSQCKRCSTSECELRQAHDTSSMLLTASLCSRVLPQQLIQLSVSLFVFTKRKGTTGFMQGKVQLSGCLDTVTPLQRHLLESRTFGRFAAGMDFHTSLWE